MKIFLIIASLGLTALFGCSKTQVVEVKTVDWYKTHPEQRKVTQRECANNPGTFANSPNCKNADAAAFAATMGESKIKFK